MQAEDIMKLPTDPTDEERALIQKEREQADKEAMLAVFETYRKMGYNV